MTTTPNEPDPTDPDISPDGNPNQGAPEDPPIVGPDHADPLEP
ncbi:hypothetical protein [Nocardioides mangrovicus]|nr:hypothetical protein [Nocardioides mangrovicus]